METVPRYGNLGASPTTLKGVSGVNFSKGIQRHIFTGDLSGHNFANLTQAPTATFSTTDLKAILDATGLDMAQLTATNKLELNWRHLANAGTFVGGGSDIQKVFDSGVMHATTLSCNRGEVCSIGVQAIGSSSDGSDPITESKTATAPPEVQENSAYTIDSVKRGSGGDLIPVQSINIDLGLQVEPVSSSGAQFPSAIYKTAINTTISIETMDLAQQYDFSSGVLDLTDDLIIYFARLQEGGTRYADGASEHIKMVISGHMIFADGLSENTSLQMQALWDGTADLFSFNTTSTIT